MCRRKMVSTRIADTRKHFGKTCMPFLSRKSIKWFSMLSEELYAEQKLSLLEVCPPRECCHREQQVLKSWYKLQSRTARIWGKSTLFFQAFLRLSSSLRRYVAPVRKKRTPCHDFATRSFCPTGERSAYAAFAFGTAKVDRIKKVL